MKIKLIVTLAAIASFTGAASATTVFSNNAAPGDSFSEAGASVQGEAVFMSEFFYNNVRNSGIVGINDNYARSGNGSAYMETTVGPGGASSKADIELLAGGVDFGGNFYAGGSMGRLGDLTTLSYEWYRDSASSNSAVQHPVVRLLVDADGDLGTTDDRGGLVFEQAYNGSVVPVDTWVSEDVFAYNAGSGANLWTFGAGMAFAEEGYGVTLNSWQAGLNTISGDSAIVGISMGVGSGWGPFQGAVDNLTVGFAGGATQMYNFEVAPTPGAAAVLGLAGFAGLRRRR